MRSLLTAFGLVAVLFCHPSPSQVIERAQASVVRITGVMDVEEESLQAWHPAISWTYTQDGARANYVCSGFVIGHHLVQTAAHCVGKDMTADGIKATVLKVSKGYDLALLDVATDKAPLKFRDSSVERFEMLNGIGYAWGWTVQSVLAERAFLVDTAPYEDGAPGLIVQFGYIGGMSGGPVIDNEGKVVGIVQQSNGQVGYGVATNLIRAFLVGVHL